MSDPVREALAELVALKDLKDKLEAWPSGTAGYTSETAQRLALETQYAQRKPLAWAAARAALAQPAEPVTWRQRVFRKDGSPYWSYTDEPIHGFDSEPLYLAAPTAPQPAEPVALTDEQAGWQPIETAPQTGRKIILFYLIRNNVPRTVMARWLTDEQAAETDADDVGLKGGWYECIDNWDDYTEVAIHEGEPSHWMPLPVPPVAHGIKSEGE